MSVNITQPGGITAESDPTALKIANNLSDLQDSNVAKSWLGLDSNSQPSFISVAASFEGNTTYYTHTGIVFPDGTQQTTAAGGGGSAAYFSVTGNTSEGFLCEAGIDSGSTGEDNGKTYVNFFDSNSGIQHFAKLVCGQSDAYGFKQHGLNILSSDGTTINGIFKFGYWPEASSIGWKTSHPIVFPDNTVQVTAYTGGGGGGLSEHQRMADAIVPMIGLYTQILYQYEQGDVIEGQFSFGQQNMLLSLFNRGINWGFYHDAMETFYQVGYYDFYYFSTIPNPATSNSSGGYMRIRVSEEGQPVGDSFTGLYIASV